MTLRGGGLAYHAPGLIFAAALAFAPVRIARAADGPAEQADDLIKRGVKLRQENKIEDALDLFRKAQALAPSGRALAQIGSAEAALERWIDAEDHLADALTRHDSPWIDAPKNREMFEKLLAKARDQTARIRIESVPGAAIEVNGRPVGTTPLADFVRVPQGKVEIAGTAPGRKPVRKDIFLMGGDVMTTRLDFDPLPGPSPPPPPARPDVSAAPSKSAGSAWKAWTGAFAIAGGVAAIVAGAYSWSLDGKNACDPPLAQQECPYIYATKKTGIAFIAGGALLAGGGVWLMLSGAADRRTGVAVGPGTLALVGRF